MFFVMFQTCFKLTANISLSCFGCQSSNNKIDDDDTATVFYLKWKICWSIISEWTDSTQNELFYDLSILYLKPNVLFNWKLNFLYQKLRMIHIAHNHNMWQAGICGKILHELLKYSLLNKSLRLMAIMLRFLDILWWVLNRIWEDYLPFV